MYLLLNNVIFIVVTPECFFHDLGIVKEESWNGRESEEMGSVSCTFIHMDCD